MKYEVVGFVFVLLKPLEEVSHGALIFRAKTIGGRKRNFDPFD
jgi:hypothetical protein